MRPEDTRHPPSIMNWFSWALLSAGFAGLTAVLAKAGVTGVNSHLATAVRTTVVLGVTWALAVAAVPLPAAIRELTPRHWLWLTLSGLATALSWICYFRALQLGEVSRVAPVDKLGLVFAMLLAMVFLRERIGWQGWAGGGLIVAGALLLSWKPHT